MESVSKTKMCFRCHNVRQATIKCDCLQCNCGILICSTCFKSARCRNCSINCRNWLSCFFKIQDEHDLVELTTFFNNRQETIKRQRYQQQQQSQFQHQQSHQQKRYKQWNESYSPPPPPPPPPPPSPLPSLQRLLPLPSYSLSLTHQTIKQQQKPPYSSSTLSSQPSTSTTSLTLKKQLPSEKVEKKPTKKNNQMTEFVLISEWEEQPDSYCLDLTNKLHRRLLYRAKFELHDELQIRKNYLPLGTIPDHIIIKLTKEYESIIKQYKEQVKLYQVVINENRPVGVAITEECEYCKLITDGILTKEEIQRHDDYHIQRSIYESIKLNMTENITNGAEDLFQKSKGKYSLTKCVTDITNHIKSNICHWEKKMNQSFNQIRTSKEGYVFDYLNSKKQAQKQKIEYDHWKQSIDINMPNWKLSQFQLQHNNNNKNDGNTNMYNEIHGEDDNDILQVVKDSDSGRCQHCSQTIKQGLDHNQDWAFNKEAIRINDVMYCRKSCVIEHLPQIEMNEVSIQLNDPICCITCFKILPKTDFGFYCNDFLYDLGCHHQQQQKCSSCCIIRVGNHKLYCNHKCAGFICSRSSDLCNVGCAIDDAVSDAINDAVSDAVSDVVGDL